MNIDEMNKYEKYFQANKARWNELVPIHYRSKFYDVESFKNGNSTLLSVEKSELSPVQGKSLLHLQCHFGLDTLSWAREGAEVTGIDFSEKAIQTAQNLSQELNIPAKFICCNVYDMNKYLNTQFDIIFTSYGVLCWLPDLERWANMISRSLKQGGCFYLIDIHPFGDMLDEDHSTQPVLKYRYHSEKEQPVRYESKSTYADSEGNPSNLHHKTEYGWFHSIGEIITAIAQSGLIIDYLHEFPYTFWKFHPGLQKRNDKYYEFPNLNPQIPLMFSIHAHNP